MCFYSNPEKILCTEQYQAFRDFNLLLIYSLMQLWFVWVFRKYLIFATHSNDPLPIFVPCLCPEFCSRDMSMYLVFYAFTSRSILLLATNTASMFLTACMFSLNKLSWSPEIRSCWVPFNFSPSWFAWTFLTAYSWAQLKRDVEKVHLSACSRSFLIENVWDKYLSMGTLHYVSVQHFL
jgi:hypothetical protein